MLVHFASNRVPCSVRCRCRNVHMVSALFETRDPVGTLCFVSSSTEIQQVLCLPTCTWSFCHSCFGTLSVKRSAWTLAGYSCWPWKVSTYHAWRMCNSIAIRTPIRERPRMRESSGTLFQRLHQTTARRLADVIASISLSFLRVPSFLTRRLWVRA